LYWIVFYAEVPCNFPQRELLYAGFYPPPVRFVKTCTPQFNLVLIALSKKNPPRTIHKFEEGLVYGMWDEFGMTGDYLTLSPV